MNREIGHMRMEMRFRREHCLLFCFKLFTSVVEKAGNLLEQLMQPDVHARIELHVDRKAIHSV